MRPRKELLEKKIQRFAAAIAHGGALDSLVYEIATREAELKGITNRLFRAQHRSMVGCARFEFVEKGISDSRCLLNRDAVLGKRKLHSHLSETRMTPMEKGEEWHYFAAGTWNLLGTGPNAPVLELAHSDGCGGQI